MSPEKKKRHAGEGSYFKEARAKKLQQSNQGSAVDNFGKKEEIALHQMATYKVTWV